MAELNPRGRFVWHELMTTDPVAAERFYKGVTKWGVTPFPDDPSYRMWTVGKTNIGGIMAMPQEARAMGAPSQWIAYVHVPSVDDTVRVAQSRGARVYTAPQNIPNVGRFAVLSDPWGATFAVFTASGNPMGHDGEAAVGEFSWHELTTGDVAAALDFYQTLFGWEKRDAMDMGPAGVYQLYGRGGQDLGGIYKATPEMGGKAQWLCYVRVPNADTAAASVTAAGGKVFHGPTDVPGGGRIAMCSDPLGAAFAVHAAPAASTSAPKKPAKKAKTAAKKAAKKTARSARKGAKSARKSAKRRPAKRPAKRVARKAKRPGKAKRRR